MPLFQKTIISKYLKTQNPEILNQKWELFKSHFHNPAIQENIRNSKEEQYQGEFLIDLFVNVLGYTKNPIPDFNLTTEYKNVKDSRKADGAIIFDGNVTGIIELKGTNTTDLSKIEDQAFGYKSNQEKTCRYVITSNFEKLRFYIDNTLEYLEFNLFEIQQEDFNLLYLCLAVDNIKGGIPAKIKDESVSEEDVITKKLYKDYSVFKRELFQNLTELNPDFDSLELFKKSQKLLDRLLFLYFGEDRGLLPPNSVRLILEQWNKLKDLDEYVPLYSRFKKYFGYLNTGFKGKNHDVFAYNGGLFKPDEILDNINIDDELLYKHSKKLADYDYASEVDVNILGHIFENSLNEIDEIKAQLEGHEIDKTKTKRKKDGVFYTPKYITKYIVENTVGKLCAEKKAELSIVEEEYFTDKKRQQKTKELLLGKINTYRDWLHQITIIDPACGSGAFLNEALNFLITEHKYVDELEAKLTGSSLAFGYHSDSILENNLFGVDLNEESVEIAKLSLWLRTAVPNRKLNDLNNNIKCGNSLIDDPEVAGDKAFNWEQEFPQVFAKGGFDVVIGNPPYVRQELFKEQKPFLKSKFKGYNSIADLYTYFIELGIEILNKEGKFSYILPNKFLKATYGKEIREVVKQRSNIELIYDFDDFPVFEEATTYPLIFVLNKSNTRVNEFEYSSISKRELTDNPIDTLQKKKILVSKSSLDGDVWSFTNLEASRLFDKIVNTSFQLKEIVSNNIFAGIASGKNDVFIINDISRFENDTKAMSILKKILGGTEINRHNIEPLGNYLLFIPWEYDLEYSQSVKEYLLEHKEELEKRPEVKQGRFPWYCLSRYGSNNSFLLSEPKIISPFINNKCNFYLDESGEYFLQKNSMFISSNSKTLLGILNSKLSFFYLKNVTTTLQGGYYDFRRDKIQSLPISKNFKNAGLEFEEKVSFVISLNSDLKELLNRYKRSISRKFEIENLSKKLHNWYNLSYPEFVKELAKQKIKLSLSEEAEWEDYFNQEKEKAQNLQSEISKTDKEIDQMVYELYGLTKEEIEIVEKS